MVRVLIKKIVWFSSDIITYEDQRNTKENNNGIYKCDIFISVCSSEHYFVLSDDNVGEN